MMDTLWQDVRFALRSLRRTPGFTVTVVLTLAIAMGATSAMFSVINAAWLRPAPYPEPDRLFLLATPDGTSQTAQLFFYLRDRVGTFERLAAQRGSNAWTATTDQFVRHAAALVVSDDYFAAHGIALLAGREFERAEAIPGGPNLVVISEPLARGAFGTAADAVGRRLDLGGTPYTVIGVAPATFHSVPEADVWTPLRTSAADNSRNYDVIGRLRRDSNTSAAAAEFARLRGDIQQEFPRTNPNQLAATQWVPFRTARIGSLREPLLLLLGAVGALLLIACVNIASMQLTRALSRRREIATRAAVGGTRLRLLRHAFTEAMILALAGAAGGLLLARTLPPLAFSVISERLAAQLFLDTSPLVDGRVVGFVAALSAFAAVVFGVAPSLLLSRTDLRAAISESGTSTGSRRTLALRRLLAGTQVALACVLLVSAGLLVRTFINLYQSDFGFTPTGVSVGRMSLQGTFDAPQFESFLAQSIERLRSVPGVADVAASNSVPIERATNLPLLPPAGSLVADPRAVDWRYVTSGYFDVFRIPLLAGRAFDERDTAGSERVAIVNDAFARAYFGRTNVIGETIALAPAFQDSPRRIVGVVGNSKGRSGAGWTRGSTALGSDVPPTIFHPAGQAPMLQQSGRRTLDIAWSIRTVGPLPNLQSALRDAARAIDPRAVLVSFESMSDVIARDVELPRLIASLLTAFSAIGVLLAALGLYGLMAHAASQRTREVGIRIALGATATTILRRFLSEGLQTASVGAAVGIAGAALATRLLGSLLFGVTPLDAGTFVGVAAFLLLVATIARVLPASRAARTNPVTALRVE